MSWFGGSQGGETLRPLNHWYWKRVNGSWANSTQVVIDSVHPVIPGGTPTFNTGYGGYWLVKMNISGGSYDWYDNTKSANQNLQTWWLKYSSVFGYEKRYKWSVEILRNGQRVTDSEGTPALYIGACYSGAGGDFYDVTTNTTYTAGTLGQKHITDSNQNSCPGVHPTSPSHFLFGGDGSEPKNMYFIGNYANHKVDSADPNGYVGYIYGTGINDQQDGDEMHVKMWDENMSFEGF